ncbi:MAG TPA: septum formation initiator family protein [Gammaproteobacteria bacterium]|jgi:cell division protein FtsB|nr:septum formation initiator family protein [Gammaproteobacteria bacterium]
MVALRSVLLLSALVGVLVFLQYRLWVEPGGVLNMMQLKKDIASLEKDNEKLKKRNETLLFQVKGLRNSKDSVESRARNELGMIKKDETFYQILKKDSDENSNQ